MTKLDREMRRRERRRIADLNKNSEEVFRGMVRITVFGLALLAGVIIILLAAAVRADQEAFAATLRHTRLIREEMAEDREYLQVPPLPEFPPAGGEPPQAIEVVSKTEIAKAETIPEEQWESLGTYRLTFYCPCYECSEGWGHKTSSGATAVEGVTVAVDPRIIPYGTRLKIDGHEYVAQDCGGSIKGNRIDIFMESHSECVQNGIKHTEVFVRK